MEDFEQGWTPDAGNYCKNLVEFGSGKALTQMCRNIEEEINNGSFSRLSYDIMLAWERPTYYDDDEHMVKIHILYLDHITVCMPWCGRGSKSLKNSILNSILVDLTLQCLM